MAEDSFEVWMAGSENAYIQFGSKAVPYAAYRVPFSKEAIDYALPIIEYFESVWAQSGLGESVIIAEARKGGAAGTSGDRFTFGQDPQEFLRDRNAEALAEAERNLPTTGVRRQQGESVRPDYDLKDDEAWAGDVSRDLGLAEDVEFCEACGHEMVFHPGFFNPKTKKKVSDRLVCHAGCKGDKGYPLAVWLGD